VKNFWHKVPIKRKNTYRRLPLEHGGAANLISEHTIVRSHDRSLPLMIKMFMSQNYGKRNFAATDTKVPYYNFFYKDLGIIHDAQYNRGDYY